MMCRKGRAISMMRKMGMMFLVVLMCGEVGGKEMGKVGQSPSAVIIILCDALRADHLGVYGYDRGTSPVVDRLSREGMVFLNAYAPSSWTIPSVSSLFTSLYPSQHGVYLSYQVLPLEFLTLAEAMKKRGYYTAAFVENQILAKDYFFDQGFDHYSTALSEQGELLQWIANYQGDQPLFLYLHYLDPHSPYSPPLPYGERFKSYDQLTEEKARKSLDRPEEDQALGLEIEVSYYRDNYDGEINLVDSQIGRLLHLLEERGIYQQALIFFLADHGEEFLDHGGWDHGDTLFEELIHIPLIVKLPENRFRGKLYSEKANLVDIYPTILSLCFGEKGAHLCGRDLSYLWKTDSNFSKSILEKPNCLHICEDCIFSELNFSEHSQDQCALIKGFIKTIYQEKHNNYSLYNLNIDPGEKSPYSAQKAEERTLLEKLRELMEMSKRYYDTSDKRYKINDQNRLEVLKTLGYVDRGHSKKRYSMEEQEIINRYGTPQEIEEIGLSGQKIAKWTYQDEDQFVVFIDRSVFAIKYEQDPLDNLLNGRIYPSFLPGDNIKMVKLFMGEPDIYKKVDKSFICIKENAQEEQYVCGWKGKTSDYFMLLSGDKIISKLRYVYSQPKLERYKDAIWGLTKDMKDFLIDEKPQAKRKLKFILTQPDREFEELEYNVYSQIEYNDILCQLDKISENLVSRNRWFRVIVGNDGVECGYFLENRLEKKKRGLVFVRPEKGGKYSFRGLLFKDELAVLPRCFDRNQVEVYSSKQNGTEAVVVLKDGRLVDYVLKPKSGFDHSQLSELKPGIKEEEIKFLLGEPDSVLVDRSSQAFSCGLKQFRYQRGEEALDLWLFNRQMVLISPISKLKSLIAQEMHKDQVVSRLGYPDKIYKPKSEGVLFVDSDYLWLYNGEDMQLVVAFKEDKASMILSRDLRNLSLDQLKLLKEGLSKSEIELLLGSPHQKIVYGSREEKETPTPFNHLILEKQATEQWVYCYPAFTLTLSLIHQRLVHLNFKDKELKGDKN